MFNFSNFSLVLEFFFSGIIGNKPHERKINQLLSPRILLFLKRIVYSKNEGIELKSLVEIVKKAKAVKVIVESCALYEKLRNFNFSGNCIFDLRVQILSEYLKILMKSIVYCMVQFAFVIFLKSMCMSLEKETRPGFCGQ